MWKLGKEGRLYVGAAGSTAATIVPNIDGDSDVDLELENEEAEVKVREIDWTFSDVVSHKATLGYQVKVAENDTVITDILAAWLSGAARAFLFRVSETGAITFDADFIVTKASVKQAGKGHQIVSFSFKPSYAEGRTPALAVS